MPSRHTPEAILDVEPVDATRPQFGFEFSLGVDAEFRRVVGVLDHVQSRKDSRALEAHAEAVPVDRRDHPGRSEPVESRQRHVVHAPQVSGRPLGTLKRLNSQPSTIAKTRKADDVSKYC